MDTIDPHVLGAENNLLRALVERLELLARVRQQPVSVAAPSSNPNEKY
jgi:hypothetical protein